MECKWSRISRKMQTTKELIDTLWNVNTTPTLATTENYLELIDTLWNVNLICYFRYLAQF